MSVNLTAAPTAINNPLNRYAHRHQMPTPSPSESSTPSSASPSSPRNASTSPGKHPLRSSQLKPPKTPCYIPAVLRPTENPSRHRPSKSTSSQSETHAIASISETPITPPSSGESSFDSKEGQKTMEDTIQQRLMASEGIKRIVTDEWTDDAMEDVTGRPTRLHWKPDSLSPRCEAPICSQNFNLLRRRHHCRRCGNIYCGSHSDRAVPLDQHARFHPEGIMARACKDCWEDYEAWRRRRGQRGSTSGSEGTGSGAATPIPGASSRGHSRMDSSVAGFRKGKDAVVGSVPRDWNWSTF